MNNVGCCEGRLLGNSDMFDASTKTLCSDSLRDACISLSWHMFQNMMSQTRHTGDSLCLACLLQAWGALRSHWGGLSFAGVG